jgi:hypothetical protein
MCKEMPFTHVNKGVDPKRIIGKNGGLRRRRGTRGGRPKINRPIGDRVILLETRKAFERREIKQHFALKKLGSN